MAFDSFGLGDGCKVDAAYAIDCEVSGPSYPWIQADVKQPGSINDTLCLGISGEALALLPDGALDKVIDMGTASFSDIGTKVDFGRFNGEISWVVLARPKVFGFSKSTKSTVPLSKGMRERGEISVAKLLLAAVIGGKVVCDLSDRPQIFTLKLTSHKTSLVGDTRDRDYRDFGQARFDGYRTIEQLNQAIIKHNNAKPSQWLAHTVAIKLGAIPAIWGKEKRSLAVRYVIEPDSNAKPLAKSEITKIMNLITTEDFRELARSPFGARKPPEEVVPSPAYAVDDEDGDMPF